MIKDKPGFIENVLALNNAHAVKGAIKDFDWAPAMLADYCEDIAASSEGWGWCGAIYFDDGTALVLHQNEHGQWRVYAVSHDAAQEELEKMRYLFEGVLPED